MNAADRDEHDPDRDQQQAAALEHLRERRVEDDGQGEHRAERRQGRVAGGAEQREHLAGGEHRDDRDRHGDGHAAEGEDDEQERDEDGGGDRPLTHRP